MKKISLLSACLLSIGMSGYAQIISPDTVTAGTPVSFSSADTGASYTWSFDNIDLTPTAPGPYNTIMSGNFLNSPSFSCTVKDKDKWYSFVTNYGSGNIVRMDHGSSPANNPVTDNLGNYGMTAGICGGIDIVRDEMTGNWFGFVVNGTYLLRLEFGSSLANAPASSLMNFPGTLAWPHEFKVRKFGTKWLGFAGNRSSGIAKFDFGASLTNTPSSTELPMTNMQSPTSFSLISEKGNWYMFVANLTPGTISRFDFGPDINNNNPASVLLGNFGSLYLTRKVALVRDCGQLFAYINDEYSRLYKLDLGNATNMNPALTVLSDIDYNNFELIADDNKIRAMILNANGSAFKTSVFNTLDAGTTFTNYHNPVRTQTFSTPGIYDVQLTVDMGNLLGNRAYCKQIVVKESHTAIADVKVRQDELVLFPNPGRDYVNISVAENDIYTLTMVNSMGRKVIDMPSLRLSSDAPYQLNLADYQLPAGVYYLKAAGRSGNCYTAKFVRGAN